MRSRGSSTVSGPTSSGSTCCRRRDPEQCNGLMDWSFVNQAWTAMWEVTSYKEWLFDTDYSNAFEAHRRILQHLQWQVPGTWVLKYPKHMMALDALLRAYPDARFVWSHRDPGVVVPSALSLTSFYRSQNRSYDPMLFGREWALLEEICADRGSRSEIAPRVLRNAASTCTSATSWPIRTASSNGSATSPVSPTPTDRVCRCRASSMTTRGPSTARTDIARRRGT